MLSEETLDQFLLRDLEVLGYVRKNPVDCPYLDWIVIRDGQKVFRPAVRTAQSDVTASLADHHASEDVQGSNKIGAAKIARYFHAGMTRSRTMCSRIMAGA